MLGCLPIMFSYKEVRTVQNANRYKRMEDRETISHSRVKMLVLRMHVDMLNLSRLCLGSDLSKLILNLSMSTNIPIAGWIIPPSLRNNSPHCLLIQTRKLVGKSNSRVLFPLC